MVKTYQFKLYNAKRNKKLHKQIVAAGKTYNHCVALKRRYYRLYHVGLSKKKLQKHLTKLNKLPKFSYLKEFGSQAVQNITDRIERGYEKFYRKENKRPPKFKKLRKFKSFTLKQAGWSLDEKNHTITINKQKYHYHKSREIEGIVKTVTVKRNSLGEIYIFLVCQVAQQNEVLPRMGKSIGFDFGFKGHILVAPTEEDDVAAPRFFRKNRNKLKKMQRRIAKKLLANTDHFVKKGKGLRPVFKRPLWQCKNLQKLFKAEARLHRKIKNQRTAYHWQLAYDLCGKYAFISLESLNMRWMQKSHGKKVNEYGFANFVTILQYVASQWGTTVIKIDKWYPSSQLCSECGYKNKEVKNLQIREWDCPHCGSHHDRDRNAAKNILAEGLRVFQAA